MIVQIARQKRLKQPYISFVQHSEFCLSRCFPVEKKKEKSFELERPILVNKNQSLKHSVICFISVLAWRILYSMQN